MERAKRGTWGKHHWFPYGQVENRSCAITATANPVLTERKGSTAMRLITNGRVSGPVLQVRVPETLVTVATGATFGVAYTKQTCRTTGSTSTPTRTSATGHWATPPRSRALTILPEGSS